MIMQLDDNTFELTARGAVMTLTREGDRWVMYTVNAVVRAYRNGYATPKYFGSLVDVEAKYKTWRGVAALVEVSA